MDGPFDQGLIVLRYIGGRRFGLDSCGIVADSLRKTLMSRFGENAPEWLCGHTPDRSPSQLLRPTYLPLGFVDHENADGRLLGVAVAMPRGFAHADMLFELLFAHDEPGQEGIPYLELGVKNQDCAVGSVEFELDNRPVQQRQYNLQPETWTAASSIWATITPVVMPQFPRRALTAEAVVAKACTQAGYPEPIAVRVAAAPIGARRTTRKIVPRAKA